MREGVGYGEQNLIYFRGSHFLFFQPVHLSSRPMHRLTVNHSNSPSTVSSQLDTFTRD